MTGTADIVEVLAGELAGDPARFETAEPGDGMPTLYVPREELVDIAGVLRNAPALQLVLLADISATDYFPREPRFEVVYLLACPGAGGFGGTPRRLRLKVRVPGDNPRLATVSGVWPAANWAEREMFDLFGIEFDGHTDLRRILMPDDWEGFPLRKDYPVQIKEPVKTAWPLQVSQEEFVANLEATRVRTRTD